MGNRGKTMGNLGPACTWALAGQGWQSQGQKMSRVPMPDPQDGQRLLCIGMFPLKLAAP